MNVFSKFLWNVGIYSRRRLEKSRVEEKKWRETGSDRLNGAISEISFAIEWIKQHPEKGEPWALALPLIKRGGFHCETGNFAEAKADYQAVIDLPGEPGNEELRHWKDEAFGRLAKVDKKALKMPDSNSAQLTGEEAEAEHLYQLGLCARTEKRSRKYFSRAIQAKGASAATKAKALIERACLGMPWGGIQKGDHSQAITDLTTALAIADIPDEQKRSALSWRATFLRQTTTGSEEENQQRAAQDEAAAEATLMVQDSAHAHLRRAYDKIKDNDLDGAIKDFERALKWGASEFVNNNGFVKSDAYWHRAELHRSLGNWHEAIADYTTSLFEQPRESGEWYAKLFLARGACKKAVGDFIGAAEDYESVIRMRELEESYGDKAQECLNALEMPQRNRN